MEVEILSSPEQLAPLASAWTELAEAATVPTPFHSYEWLAERWRRLELNGRILVARDGEALQAALPLEVGSGPVRVGSFLAGPYSGLDLMLRRGAGEEAASALLEHLAELPVDYLELYGFSSTSLLARSLPPSARPIRLDGAPSMQMEAGWEAAYNLHMNGKHRWSNRRALAKLGEAGAVEFRIARTPAEVATAIEETFRLHDLRWSARRKLERSNYSGLRDFHRRAAAALARRDEVRIVLLELDGTAIAFVYSFAYAGTMFLHRVAFDPAFSAYSPGLLVLLCALEEGGRDGLTRVEFLRGQEEYKLRLADTVDDVLWVASFPQTARGRVACWSRTSELRLRQRAKSSERLLHGYESLVKLKQRRTNGSSMAPAETLKP